MKVCSAALGVCCPPLEKLSPETPSIFGTGLNLETGQKQMLNELHSRSHVMQISCAVLEMKLPLLLLDGLLSQRHVLHVLLQPVQRRVRLHADPVIVILRVPSKIQDEKHEMRHS